MVRVELSKDKKQIIVTADIETLQPSASGKTLIVASTRGNLKTDVKIEHDGQQKPLTIGFNAYIAK